MIGTTIRVTTPSQAIVAGVREALRGDRVSARGLPAYETRYPTIVVARPWMLPPKLLGRNPKWVIGALEACSLVGQVSVPEWLTSRVDAFSRFQAEGVFWGAYGPRIAGQLGLVVETLIRDPESRQAVITIFDGHRDLLRETPDMPCTVAIQFMVRGGRVESRVMMRSNDAWLGLTYDVVQFIALQGAVAKALDLPMGAYVHQAGSLHLYTSDATKAAEIADIEEEPADYAPLWSGATINEIAEDARDIGAGTGFFVRESVTPFEAWMIEEIAK